jgi:hypothetical protein
LSPANRQAAVRWLRTQTGVASRLSPYLNRAVEHADANADVLIAIDLDSLLNAEMLPARLKALAFIKEAEIPRIAEVLSEIQGIMLGITVGKKISGSLRVDFAGDAAAIEPVAKQLLEEALSSRGIMIEDMSDWAVRRTPNGISFSGMFSKFGFRQVLSIVRHSIQHDLTMNNSDSLSDSAETSIATRSKQYFDKLALTLDEMSKVKGRAINTYAGLFENYARDIDELSVLGIDEDLVKFGLFFSDSYRNVAAVLRGSEFDRRSMQTELQDTFYTERYGIYGRYTYSYDYSGERRAIRVQQNVQGEREAREILKNLEKQMGEARRGLSAKYQVNF